MPRIRTVNPDFSSLPGLRGWGINGGERWLSEKRERWIYFAHGDDGGPVKIGSTKTPEYRLTEIQIGYPFGALAYCALVLGTQITEREYQARFWSTHIRGEWFAADATLAAFILSVPEPG